MDEALDRLESHVASVADKMAELAEAHGQQFVDFGLAVARVDAANAAIKIVLLWAISGLLVLCARSLLRWGAAQEEPERDMAKVAAVFCVGLAFLPGLTGLFAGAWPFIGVFYPEMWVAKQVLGL